MRSGKDDEKLTSPLFPRLHINDAEKGGPRAAPRNKMALYEQLSIPSQRSTTGLATMLPLPRNNTGILVPSTSSSHGGDQKRSVHSPLCKSPASSRLAESLHSYSSGGINVNNTPKNHTSSAAGKFLMTTNGSLSQPHSSSNTKNSFVKKLSNTNAVRVPTFLQSAKSLNLGDGQHNMDKEKLITSSPSRQHQAVCVKQHMQSRTAYVLSCQPMRNQSKENLTTSPSCPERFKGPFAVLKDGDELFVDASLGPVARVGTTKSVKQAVLSVNEEKRSRSPESDEQLLPTYRALHDKKALTNGILAEPKKAVKKSDFSSLEGLSYSGSSPDDYHRTLNKLENVRQCEENRFGSFQLEEVDKNADMSDASIVDSISGVDISADDVVGVIGQQQFWKARRTIVHQQRVFAVQVFELHRLIKVQRMIAASPNIYLESELCLGKPFIKVLPLKKLSSENVSEAPLLAAQLNNNDLQHPQPNIEHATESTLGKAPLLSLNSNTTNELNTLQPNHKPFTMDDPLLVKTATDPKPPCCFHLPPPGNQWLVPVMSPSEGLVFKPYAGPCPPSAEFMAPVYGSCGPMSLNTVGRDFFHKAYATPIGQTCFSPYSMPLMKRSFFRSPVDQVSPFCQARSNMEDNHLSLDINFTTGESSLNMSWQNNRESSLNMSWQNNRVNSYRVKNLEALKESEVQASTASSPDERGQGDVLPLFPIAPSVQVSDQPGQAQSTEKQSRVIKVVPHNPRTASESAARIFQSIQEERRL